MNLSSPLEYGVQTTLVPSQSLNSSSITKSLTLQSSACIIGVLIPALTGDVIIDVYSVAGDGDVLKTSQTFSTTTDLTQIRVNDVMGVLRITVTAAATATLEVKIKAAHTVSTSSGGGTDVNDSAIVVQNPTIQNTTATLAGTEYSIVLPANTKRFILRARDSAKLQIAYVSGQTATEYYTVYPGFCLAEDSINKASLTVYFQSSKAGEEIEVKSWA